MKARQHFMIKANPHSAILFIASLLLVPALAFAADETPPEPAGTPAAETKSPATVAPLQAPAAPKPQPAAVPLTPLTPAVQPAPNTASIPTKPAPAVPLGAKPATPQPAPASIAPAAAIKPVPVPAIKPAATPTSAPAVTKPVATQPAGIIKPPIAPAKPATTPAPALSPPIGKPPVAPVTAKPPVTPAITRPIPAQPLNIGKPQVVPAPTAAIESTAQTADLEVFVREGCDNCEKAKEFLDKLHNLQPQLTIHIRDVRKEPASMELLKRVAQNQGTAILDYPAFVVSGQLIFGFTDEANTIQQILDNLPLTHSTSDDSELCENSSEPGCGLLPAPPPDKAEKITLSLFGYSIQLAQIGLPVFTVAMGLLDGLNHGSTWVLVLLIALLVPLQDRGRLMNIAGSFIVVQGLIYFIIMAVWFNVIAAIETTRLTQYIFAGISILAAIIYFKNYLVFGQRLSILSHEISKPGIYTYIRRIVEAQNYIPALLGTIVLAIFVQIGELTLTTAFPALYSKILKLQHLGLLSNYAYLALYDLAYMLDDIIILGVALWSLKQERSDEIKSKNIFLYSGLLLTACAIYLLLVKY